MKSAWLKCSMVCMGARPRRCSRSFVPSLRVATLGHAPSRIPSPLLTSPRSCDLSSHCCYCCRYRRHHHRRCDRCHQGATQRRRPQRMLALSRRCLDFMPGPALPWPFVPAPASPYAAGSNASDFAATAFSTSPVEPTSAVPLAMTGSALTTGNALT